MSTLITSSLLALSLAASAVASPLSTSSHNIPSGRSPYALAPLVDEDHIHGTVNNSYIVKLRDDVPAHALSNHFNFMHTMHESDPLVGDNSGPRHVYTHVKGYSGYFSESVVQQLRGQPEVEYVERDQIVRISDEALSPAISTQKGAPWGLARISHREPLSFGTFQKYVYDSDGGEGVDVYVIDTGISVTHPEFEGRAAWGATIPQNDVDEDANGHGTHCAGTIASKKYGVAKKANVFAVKVLGSNGSGTMSDVIAGVEWAAQSAQAKAQSTSSSKHKGSVANMSLGGGKSPTLDQVVNKATDAGLHFAVAAGNENRDACNSSPAAAEKAITVGASTIGDQRAYFSNHGKCVDVFGPGLNIKSTWPNGQTNTISGTSMASPHVAGLAAYLVSIYRSETFPEITSEFDVSSSGVMDNKEQSPLVTMYSVAHAVLPPFISGFLPSPRLFEVDAAPIPSKLITPAQLKKALLGLATPGLLEDLPAGTPNLLIFNNATVA